MKNISLGMTGRWVKNISLGMTQFFILSWKIEEYNSPLALKAESEKIGLRRENIKNIVRQ